MISVIDRPNFCDRDASEARTFANDRDLALADAAHDLVLAAERIAWLETDRAVYRELALALLDALCAMTVERARQRESLFRANSTNRALREHVLLSSGADDDGPA